jgi:hypothetical protein
MKNKSESMPYSIPIACFLIMFTAKIFGFTDISYWIVFLPLYFDFALLLFLLIAYLFVVFFVLVFSSFVWFFGLMFSSIKNFLRKK